MPNEILDNPGSVRDFALERGVSPTEVLPEYTEVAGAYRGQCIGEGSTRIALSEQSEDSKTEEEK